MVASLATIAAFVFCSPNDLMSGLKVTNKLYPICSSTIMSDLVVKSSIKDDHPKRRRRRTTSDTTDAAKSSSMTNLISKEEALKSFMDANAAQYEAGNALADAAAALADEEETLARHYGLEMEDLEYAIDSMEGYYDDDNIWMQHLMFSTRRKQVYHPHHHVLKMMLTMILPI